MDVKIVWALNILSLSFAYEFLSCQRRILFIPLKVKIVSSKRYTTDVLLYTVHVVCLLSFQTWDNILLHV